MDNMEKTLRDEFAKAAMQAIIIALSIDKKLPDDNGGQFDYFWDEIMNDRGFSDRSCISETSYEIADAMKKIYELSWAEAKRLDKEI